MDAQRGLRRPVALILCLLLLLLLPQSALGADSSEPEVLVESAPEPAEPEVAPPSAEPPVSAEEPPVEDEIQPERDPEEQEATETPAPQEAAQIDENYDAEWAAGAFLAQTVNYEDELIIGMGASYRIAPARDIQLLLAGKPVEQEGKLRIECDTSNAKYLSVSASGQIKGKKKGSAQVYVTVRLPDGSQKQLRKNVKVVDTPAIRFAPNYAVLGSGDRVHLGQHAKVPLLTASPNVNAGVRFDIKPISGSSASRIALDADSGRLDVEYAQPGEHYQITARTYSGEQAQFFLYLGKKASRIEIFVNPGALDEGEMPTVAAGQKQIFKAAAYDADGALAARQDIEWSVFAPDGSAYIDEQGVLSVAHDLDAERSCTIVASAMDGGGATVSLNVALCP